MGCVIISKKEILPETLISALPRLLRRAETMLPPDVAMKIECAADTEPSSVLREELYAELSRIFDCGINDKPLFSRRGAVFLLVRVGESYKGPDPVDALADALPEAELYRQSVPGDSLGLVTALFDPEHEGLCETSPYSGEAKDFLEFVIESAHGKRSSTGLPVFIGAGAGQDEREAKLLARLALLRPMDKEHRIQAVKRLEIRARSRLNRLSRDAGTGTAALSVHMELGDSNRHAAVCFSPPALRRSYFF